MGENGRYEELIACSHEIAGSTAQLVAASKVQKGLLLFLSFLSDRISVVLSQRLYHLNDCTLVFSCRGIARAFAGEGRPQQ